MGLEKIITYGEFVDGEEIALELKVQNAPTFRNGLEEKIKKE